MKCVFASLIALFALCTAASPAPAQVAAVPAIMNFQGRLARPDGTSAPDGAYSIRFSLWTAASGGTEKWNQTLSSVSVRNGGFATRLDVSTGAADKFNGDLWMEIKIGSDPPLAPRQRLATVPYAFKAGSVADGSVTGAGIVDGTLTAAKFPPSFFNSTAWLLGGNSGVGTGFLGTTDNVPLEFRVNGRRAMRYTFRTAVVGNAVNTSLNVVGGCELNTIDPGVIGATIVGGGYDSSNATDYPNSIATGGDYSTISGGLGNLISNSTATISGGFSNTASGQNSTIAGGSYNTASALFSTVIGGYRNTSAAPGSFAAGQFASANHSGSFVWSDGSASFASLGPSQFCIQASGGILFEAGTYPTLFTASTAGDRHRYLALANSPQTQTAAGLKAGGILCSDSYDYSNPGKNDMTVKGRAAIGFDVNITAHRLAVNGTLYCIGFTNASDARFKQNIAPFDNALDTILDLRGVHFDWKPTTGMDFPAGRQVGFLAQEVEKVLPELVTTDRNGYKSVNYMGVVPVLVEAVKTQHKQRQADREEIAGLKAKNAELEARLLRLEAAFRNMK